jgi:hypothetical protein
MPAINRKDMRPNEFLPPAAGSGRRLRNAPRATFLLLSFLGLIVLSVCSSGCAPSSSPPGEGAQGPVAASNDLPELTEEMIREQIDSTRIRKVPEENGAADPINWSFYEQDPEEIAVVERQINGTHATVVLDIKTRSAPKAREQRSLAGQIRTEWELKTGWLLRRWELVGTENISMKYKNLPKPPAQNSNR